MSNRVERLRIWLVGGAVFLLLVIAGYIGVARYVRHRFLTNLPAKLGVDIKSDANVVTLSRYDDKLRRTLYVIHASKQTEFINGTMKLHNVDMILYGRKGDRADRIYGDEFEYDQKDGVIRATGVVHIDLQASSDVGKPADAKVVHVTTSGLVYLEKLGVAATSERIDFQTGAMTGHAIGADYNSDSGMLMLHSAVSMSGFAGGRPVELTAATAQFDQRSQQAFLTRAKYGSPGRAAQAEEATLYRRADGSLARVEAQGNVTIQANGGTEVSQRADVTLNAASEPQIALLKGGVVYTLDEPLRQVRGTAKEATIGFDAQARPQPKDALFTGAVHMIERTRATEAAREPWSVRDLTADKFEAELAPAGDGKSQLRNAEATGNAHLTVVNNGSLASTAGEGREELSADDLKAHLMATGDAKQPPQVDTIAGRGHTVLHQVKATGVEQTSMGDTLDAKLRPAAANQKPAAGGAARSAEARNIGNTTLVSAVQQGHIDMLQRVPAKQGNAAVNAQEEVRHATAQRAVYDGDLDRITLTGAVQMRDAEDLLWANQLELDQATGDAHAVGAVKVDYVQEDSAKGGPGQAAAGRTGRAQPGEPTHILADRAELEHATDTVIFYGKPVRLWQGGSQVQAPEIEMEQQQKRLIARGAASTGQSAQVHTVLSSRNDTASAQSTSLSKDAPARCVSATGGAGKGGPAATGAPQVVRIASGGLTYLGTLGEADFTGGVRADTIDATIYASQATAYLEQPGTNPPARAGKDNGAAAVLSLTGPLDRVVAAGHVDIERPGLEATGERLVYTTHDQVSLLTGTKDAPPRAVDAQGTTTGAALRIRNTCDAGGGVSVEALGDVPGESVQRVHTETRVPDDRNKEKGRK